MRRAAKVDRNQKEIVQALRNMGCTVAPLHAVGGGVPDLLVGISGLNILLEVKDGDKKAHDLTKEQIDFFDEWRGQVQVVKSVEHAIRIVNYYRMHVEAIGREIH